MEELWIDTKDYDFMFIEIIVTNFMDHFVSFYDIFKIKFNKVCQNRCYIDLYLKIITSKINPKWVVTLLLVQLTALTPPTYLLIIIQCEEIAGRIKSKYKNIDFRIVIKHPSEWEEYLQQICRIYGFLKKSNPIIYTFDGKIIGNK